MSISDEQLMAYADGELDAAERATVEAAMRADPDLTHRVARHRELRERIHGAFAADLSEPVPESLLRAARGATEPSDLSVVRAARAAAPARAPARWRRGFAIAASLLIGVAIGVVAMRGTTAAQFALTDGGLVARGALAQALSSQLANRQSAQAPVRIGLTFLAKNGGYCRTFSVAADGGVGGLACRNQAAWQVQILTRGSATQAGGGMRQAQSELSAAVLAAVEEEISGEPLDAAAEIAARDAGWRGK